VEIDGMASKWDVQQGAARIGDFTTGKQFEDHPSSAMLRAAAERQFEIIGEALAQLAGHCP
jgi:uncharacterized protein with HEPN domain